MVRGPTVVVCAAVIFAPSLGVGSPAAAQPVVRELTAVPGVEGSYPSWAPETGTLVFHVEDEGREGLYEVRLDGTGLRRITAAPDETPVWSPDGTHVAFRRTLNGNGEVFLHEAGEGEAVNLTRHPATDFHPKFSPDGSRIVFESNRAGGDNFEVYEMGLDGSGLERLTDHPAWDTYSSISPDGKSILWRRAALNENGDRDSEVFVMERDGSSPRNLTRHPAFDGWPDWSPDGAWIAFASDREREGAFHLYVMAPDGSRLTRLTPDARQGDSFTRPVWSPDGSRIVCTRSRNGREEIVVLRLDGLSSPAPAR